MRTARSASAAALLLVTSGCELARSPTAILVTEDRVILTSVLLAGDTVARAFLLIVAAEWEPFSFPRVEGLDPVTDAMVRLISDMDTIPLTSRPDASANACIAGPVAEQSTASRLLPGCYIGSVPGGISNGKTYELIVDLPGLERIHGSTTVPAAPIVTAPAAGATVRVGVPPLIDAPPTRFEWYGPTVDQDLELHVVPDDATCSGGTNDHPGVPFSSTPYPATGRMSAELYVGIYCTDEIPPNPPGDIVLTAFDTTYSRYMRAVAGDSRHLADAVAGFTGPAIGVFGAAASVRQPVVFVH